MEGYKYTGPVNCNIDFDSSSLKGKTAIVTGGASGIGEVYVRSLVTAGAVVCFGDLDVERGEKLAAELSGQTKFVKCDVTEWDDQTRLFREAASFSPTGKISYVVANAGLVTVPDEAFIDSSTDQEPQKPNLKTLDVNINGSMYTTKLATHYFIRQNGDKPSPTQEDTCLVLISSIVGYTDFFHVPQYSTSKWAMRGLMHTLRRTAFHYGSRVNLISPWFVRTGFLPNPMWDNIHSAGIEWAQAEDAGQCLLHILSDSSISGHSFFISGRKWSSRGYMDMGLDDYPENTFPHEVQQEVLKLTPPSLRVTGV